MSARFSVRYRWLVLIVLVGGLMRLWAASTLPVDADELPYMSISTVYAAALRAGNLYGPSTSIVDNLDNAYHPALVKLLFAGASLLAGSAGTPEMLGAMRDVSVFFSTVGLLVLGLASPLAAAMLAFQTLAIEYTSEAYLEAIPFAASAAAVLLLRRSTAPRDRWFWASAALLGIAAASKSLIYLVVVPTLVYILVADGWPHWHTAGFRWRGLLPYFMLAGAVTGVLLVVGRPRNIIVAAALVVFGLVEWYAWLTPRLSVSRAWLTTLGYFGSVAVITWLLDPTLWHEPIARLQVAFQQQYLQHVLVVEQGPQLPWFLPVLSLGGFMKLVHPDVFPYIPPDAAILVLAVAGLRREWHARRWLVVWLGATLLLPVIWPFKFPQYALPAVAPLCLAAAATLERVYRWFFRLRPVGAAREAMRVVANGRG
jgi:hypothetical protein